MDRTLIFDTETTGLPQTRELFSPDLIRDFDGSRMVSIAWSIGMDDPKYYVVALDFPIPPSDYHDITQDIVYRDGRLMRVILRELHDDMNKVDTIVAHNITFDQSVVLNEAYRLDENLHNLFRDTMTSKNLVDTCNSHLSLDKYYRLHTGRDIKNHHHAEWDVRNLREAYCASKSTKK